MATPRKAPKKKDDVRKEEIQALNLQGQRKNAQGMYKEALMCFHKAARDAVEIYGEFSDNRGILLGNCAAVYSVMEDYENAEKYYRDALEVFKVSRGPQHGQVGMLLNNIAWLCKVQNKLEESYRLYREALAVKEMVHGSDHDEVATMCDEIGYLANILGESDVAYDSFKRAVEIRKRPESKSDPRAKAASMNNFAEMLIDRGEFEEAEKLHREALAIREKESGAESLEAAQSMVNLSELLMMLGKREEAIELRTKVLAINRKSRGEESAEVAMDLNQIGELYRQLGDFIQADFYFEESIAVRKKIAGPRHPKTALVLNNLAVSQQGQKNYKEAEKNYKTALSIQEEAFGVDSPEAIQTKTNLAELLIEKGGKNDLIEASSLYQDVLKGKENAMEPNFQNIALILMNLAWISSEIDAESAETEEWYTKALEAEKKASESSMGGTMPPPPRKGRGSRSSFSEKKENTSSRETRPAPIENVSARTRAFSAIPPPPPPFSPADEDAVYIPPPPPPDEDYYATAPPPPPLDFKDTDTDNDDDVGVVVNDDLKKFSTTDEPDEPPPVPPVKETRKSSFFSWKKMTPKSSTTEKMMEKVDEGEESSNPSHRMDEAGEIEEKADEPKLPSGLLQPVVATPRSNRTAQIAVPGVPIDLKSVQAKSPEKSGHEKMESHAQVMGQMAAFLSSRQNEVSASAADSGLNVNEKLAARAKKFKTKHGKKRFE